MKLLFVFTGGTIGSSVRGDLIATDDAKPRALLRAYEARHGMDFAYELLQPYTMLSENNTGETIAALCACVAEQLELGFDGIVVLHGTDTLQYTAAALSYAFSGASIPICVVSSNRPIEAEGSNGVENLHGAIRLIREVGTPGVWVPYKNTGEPLCVHNGTRLQRSMAFRDRVESLGAPLGYFCEGEAFRADPAYRALPDGQCALGCVALGACCEEILCIHPYPGIRYPEIPARVRYILHDSFHSGTINTASEEAKRFFASAAARGIPVFLTGVSAGAQYESTAAFSALGITPLTGLAPIASYVKLWMLQARDPAARVTAQQLMLPLGGDIVLS